ncbi:uncharacterized protein LOC117114710 [Anneissia japonica]|uniref:uncharacterized protein LOC117114710 n=1 Tax=Anneissia japonica TaxID=1529436 RepID=UPI0014254C82|nr:uncharacterized protein LOC117114710 [Anneissia japonica]
MVCLSKPDADTTPRSEEKQLLIDVGLGEKTVFIPDFNISLEQFCQVLYTYFPKLQDAGGFELLTCIGSERKLVTIRGKYTPQNIKDRLGQGHIYIRPIQNSLNLDPVHWCRRGLRANAKVFKVSKRIPIQYLEETH